MKEFSKVSDSFRIKEPTFGDLINIAIKATKDKLVLIEGISDWQIQYSVSGDVRYIVSHDKRRISEEINFIKSLYKEKFVIENEEDILKIRKGAIIELSNGNKCTTVSVARPLLEVCVYESVNPLNFLTLKGATVTQIKDNESNF